MKKPRFSLRPLATARILLAILAGAAAVQAVHAQVMVLTPPAPRELSVPPPRAGFAWQGGYWGWRYGRYVWVPGTWIAMRPAVAGAPTPPPPPPQPRVSQVLRLSADALFPFDRGNATDILPGGRAQIRDAASRLRGRYARIEVRGYTDRLGSSAHNLQLSRQRAEAVKALLIQNGIPAERIRASGLAAADPVSQCSNKLSHAALISCLQPDRRVEIVIYSDDAGTQYPGKDRRSHDGRAGQYQGGQYQGGPGGQYPGGQYQGGPGGQYPGQQYPGGQYQGYPGYGRGQ